MRRTLWAMRSLALCLILACVPPPVETTMASSTKISGLWTNPNDARAPEGALAVADNVVLTRPGIAEPRRGFSAQNGAGMAEAINAFHYFDGYLVAHHGTASLSSSSDDGATWTAYSGTYSPPDASTPVRFWTASGSLLFLTAAGVYELDEGDGTPRLTGVERAQDGTATRVTTTSTGWMEPDSQVAYRVAWLYKNANGKIQYGAPSGRFLVSNPAAQDVAIGGASKASATDTVTVTLTAHGFSAGDYVTVVFGGTDANFTAGTFEVATAADADTFTYADGNSNSSGGAELNLTAWTVSSYPSVSLSIPIPSTITTSHALQVFRSAESTGEDVEPSDALGLVYEAIPTNVDIAAGTITISDVTPSTLRGVDWQDVISGGAVHERPPLAKDAVQWRGVSLYADTTGQHALDLRLLSAGFVVGSKLVITDGTTDVSVTAASALDTGGSFKFWANGSTAQNIANTAKSLVRAINRNGGPEGYAAQYTSGEADAPGSIRIASSSTFYVYTTRASATAFAPNVPTLAEVFVGDIDRASSVVTVETLAAHGFTVGQTVTLLANGNASDEATWPPGTKTVASVPTSVTFTYAEAGEEINQDQQSSIFFAGSATFDTDLSSSEDHSPNGIMWSPPGEPWHVPLLNQAFVGDEGATLLRAIPTRDKVVLFTSEGIHQLYGDYPNFALGELDTTLRLAAPNTAVAAAGRVYALTTTGVVEVDQSARVVSVPIEDALRDLLANHAANVSLRAFAVAYESERLVAFFLPDDSSDAYCSQAFVYHLDSGQWTRWVLNATTGFIHPEQDRLYLGNTTAGVVWKERKARAAADHVDGASAGVASVVEWAQLMPAGPGAQALADSGSLDFQEANFASLNLKFATNLSPTLSAAVAVSPHAGATAGASEVVFPVPQEQQRGTRYRVRLEHSTASERYQLQGLTLRYRNTSKRAGR